MPHNTRMVKFKMLKQEIAAKKDYKSTSPTRDKRLKAKDYNNLASALRENLRRRKAVEPSYAEDPNPPAD